MTTAAIGWSARWGIDGEKQKHSQNTTTSVKRFGGEDGKMGREGLVEETGRVLPWRVGDRRSCRVGQGLSFARVTYSCLSAIGNADDYRHAQHPCTS